MSVNFGRHSGEIRDMKPSLKKKLAARTSFKRVVRHRLGFKVPRGYGWITNPKKAAYNRMYKKTSVGCSILLVVFLTLFVLQRLSLSFY
jgi:hypothetical protein